MLKQLIWKQWKEQAWRIIFATVVLCGFTAIGLRTRITRDEEVVIMSILLGSMILPVFIAMGLIAPHRADGSFVTMLSLPVSRLRLLGSTLVAGIAACSLPLVVTGGVVGLLAGGRERSMEFVGASTAAALCLSVLILYWTLFVSARATTEARAGMLGLAVLGGIFLVSVILSRLQGPFVWLLQGMSPISFMEAAIEGDGGRSATATTMRWAGAGLQLLVMIAALPWFARRLATPTAAKERPQ